MFSRNGSSYSFGISGGWENDDNILIFGQIIYVWHIILCANKQLLGDNHVIEINAVLIKYDFLCLLKCEDKIDITICMLYVQMSNCFALCHWN